MQESLKPMQDNVIDEGTTISSITTEDSGKTIS
jgi:hypothetical protein